MNSPVVSKKRKVDEEHCSELLEETGGEEVS